MTWTARRTFCQTQLEGITGPAVFILHFRQIQLCSKGHRHGLNILKKYRTDNHCYWGSGMKSAINSRERRVSTRDLPLTLPLVPLPRYILHNAPARPLYLRYSVRPLARTYLMLSLPCFSSSASFCPNPEPLVLALDPTAPF